MEMIEEHAERCRKIVLPASIKWEIRDKLDQANNNERTLHPGLDGLQSACVRGKVIDSHFTALCDPYHVMD